MQGEKRGREVPGLLDFFSPGTTGPRDLQGLQVLSRPGTFPGPPGTEQSCWKAQYRPNIQLIQKFSERFKFLFCLSIIINDCIIINKTQQHGLRTPVEALLQQYPNFWANGADRPNKFWGILAQISLVHDFHYSVVFYTKTFVFRLKPNISQI